jgi:protein TonB
MKGVAATQWMGIEIPEAKWLVLNAPARSFYWAIFISFLVHCVMVFALKFSFPDFKKPLINNQPLEIVLVNSKSASRPYKADALAQANLDGGGNTDAEQRAKNPLPLSQQDQKTNDLVQANKRVEQLEQQAKALITSIKSERKVTQADTQNDSKQAQPIKQPDASELIQRSIEIARLEAQIDKDWNAYQKRPKKRFVGARTQEFRFAQYVEDWRVKVERIGNLNYPEAARQQKLYGSLQLTVGINTDGSIESIEINRGSGKKILDAAAVKIVKMAGPYAAFPLDISRDTDILYITRTWIFTKGDQWLSD